MTKLSDRAVLSGFGLALLLLSGVGLASFLTAQNLLENEQWIEHTHQVMNSIDHLSDAINMAENGRRGYALSKEASYIETYKTGIQMAKEELTTVRQLTRDNSTQQQRLNELEPLVAKRLTELQQAIAISQQPTFDLATQRSLIKQGISTQQAVRSKLTEMTDEEQRLLQERSQAAGNSVRTMFIVGGIGYFLSFGLLLSVYWLLQKQIRSRQQAENALRHANDQLELGIQERTEANLALQKEVAERIEAERELEQLATRLKQSNQELEQFAYVASHDLQEPLRAVTSYTQMLSRKYQSNLDEKADKYIGYIVDGATRMQQLIHDLLTYSRVGRQDLNLQQTDCNTVLQQVLKNVQVSIAENDAVITYDSLPVVTADTAQLTQLFQNLVSNALKYHGDNCPKVHISSVKKDSQWIFSVQDNGIGIDPQYAERIFIIFQRLHTRRDYTGTGIGLAICKKIVDLHGGQIWVESQPGEGSTFYFTIPV